ncbi:MAG: outer membrane lipoprotein-sorting protein [Candidatus Aminicenantes bacterium]|nr:outer membrane lipoprotein-sorting protein [Candidatus Aminicenantes bacterium]
MNKKITTLVCLGIFCLGAGISARGQSAEEILGKVDAAVSGAAAPRDMEAVMTMTITSASGAVKTRRLRVWSQAAGGGASRRLMKFLSPPDVRDIGFLSLSDDQMYLYLPEFRRIRRIASHNKSENFVGSDFSYEDLGASAFSLSYAPSLAGQDDATWTLVLERKPGSDKLYKRIRLVVSKEALLPVRMEIHDNSGALVKVEEQENGRAGSYRVPVLIRMKDVKSGSRTELVMSDIKVDRGLTDEVFTQRNLQRRAQ